MKSIKIILTSLLLMFCLCAVTAQTIGGSNFSTDGWWNPSTTTFSPQVGKDGKVTFRLKAPHAKTVFVELGDWDIQEWKMKKDEQGIWSVVVDSLSPGIYQYHFKVDGLTMLDLENPRVKHGTSIYGNILETRGGAPLFDQTKDVPHGEVRILRYRATTLQKNRTVYVYVPPGYNEEGEAFPVLYLRHGGGDDEGSWIRDGRVADVLDNLLAERKAKPMLVVMTNGHTDGSWAGGSSKEGMDILEHELLNDVIPLVEERFHVHKSKKGRAIAGLSMGGGQAFVIGLRNMDKFNYIGQFSSGLLSDEKLNLSEYVPEWEYKKREINGLIKILWTSCGTKDPRYQGHLNFLKALDKEGIAYQSDEAPAGHEWAFWREQLAKFTVHLF
ncbi:esterase [Sphingobacterium pedocola]|uniref:Esterase n=1 Tax=Sphingobacterium pedocola TaxID=2082722 RepID=A0ABR9TBA1_9SPHI|nr:esterase [Sphingobacterium pedocola]MBE8722633.1 esterase [Sphingobacterium pedocola]